MNLIRAMLIDIFDSVDRWLSVAMQVIAACLFFFVGLPVIQELMGTIAYRIGCVFFFILMVAVGVRIVFGPRES